MLDEDSELWLDEEPLDKELMLDEDDELRLDENSELVLDCEDDTLLDWAEEPALDCAAEPALDMNAEPALDFDTEPLLGCEDGLDEGNANEESEWHDETGSPTLPDPAFASASADAASKACAELFGSEEEPGGIGTRISHRDTFASLAENS